MVRDSSGVIGFLKGKGAIHIARTFGVVKRNFVGQHFWRGNFVSTVGRDEAVVREYLRNHEQEDKRVEQTSLFRSPPLGGSQGRS